MADDPKKVTEGQFQSFIAGIKAYIDNKAPLTINTKINPNPYETSAVAQPTVAVSRPNVVVTREQLYSFFTEIKTYINKKFA